MEKQTFSSLDQVWDAIKAECREYGDNRRKKEAAEQNLKDVEIAKKELEDAQEKVDDAESDRKDLYTRIPAEYAISDRDILHYTLQDANIMAQFHLDFFTDRMAQIVNCKDRVAQDGAREWLRRCRELIALLQQTGLEYMNKMEQATGEPIISMAGLVGSNAKPKRALKCAVCRRAWPKGK